MNFRFHIFALLLLCFTADARQVVPDRPRPGIDVTAYDLSVTLPESGNNVSMVSAISVRRFAPVDTLVVDLVGMQVDEVRVQDRVTAVLRDEATVRVPLPAHSSGTEDLFTVTIRYHGTPADGFIIHTDEQGRWSAFGDNWPTRARRWIACIDHPGDKAAVSWTVDAPANLVVVANGVLTGEEPRGQRKITRWRETKPLPTYCMVVAAAPFRSITLGTDSASHPPTERQVPQSVYFLPEFGDCLPGSFVHATDIVSYFSSMAGPFPYEKLAHVQSRTIFGGMENAGAIFYGYDVFSRQGDNTGIIAHETAHQWFGDAVTPAVWSEVWLSEGFATYFGRLWQQHAYGDLVFQYAMMKSRDAVLSADICKQRPVIDTIETNVKKLLNTNTYEKAAWVLHMLRSYLGEEKFTQAIQSYVAAHRDGNARTEDLQAAFAAVAGTDMDWFFRQWLRRAGAPDLRVSWKYNPGRKAVEVRVSQKQTGPAYRLPIHVDVMDTDGFERHVMAMIPAEKEAGALIPALAKPRNVVIDPHGVLLAKITLQ